MLEVEAQSRRYFCNRTILWGYTYNSTQNISWCRIKITISSSHTKKTFIRSRHTNFNRHTDHSHPFSFQDTLNLQQCGLHLIDWQMLKNLQTEKNID